MRVRAVLGFVVALGLVGAAGCRHRHEHALVMDPSMGYGLGNADADRRKDAAEDLRKDDGPPPDAVPQLLRAIARETDPDALEEMLITLGASGAPAARPTLDAHLNDEDRHGRKGAEKGLELWSKKTGQQTANLNKVAQLGNPDPGVRREAAEDLGDHDGPPPEAVGPLLAAARAETNHKTLEAMMLTLGSSGSPEAKPVLDAYLEDNDKDVRRAAQKALKRWKSKNGQSVRRDVETAAIAPPPPMPASTAATPSAPPAAAPHADLPDACAQFKQICAADPFSLEKCRSDMKPLTVPQQQVWADCVNDSQLACQKAHDGCLLKAKKAP